MITTIIIVNYVNHFAEHSHQFQGTEDRCRRIPER